MWKKAQKLLACLLAVLLLSSATALSPAVFAVDDDTPPVLRDGETVIIPANATAEETAGILYEALVENKDEVSADDLDWQYECQGQTKLGTWGNRTFVSIDGDTTKSGIVTYTHPALSKNANDSYRVKLNGMDDSSAVTIYKYDKNPSSITLKENVTVGLKYNDDLSVNYDAVRQQIWDNVVAATEPALTLDDVTIEYRATATTGLVQDWAALEGAKHTLTYPAMTEGAQKIRVSYAGDDTHFAVSAEVDVNVVGRSDVAYTLKEGPYEVGMVFNDDLSYNYAAVEQAIFDAVLESTEPELTFDDVTIQYDANPISVDGVSNIWSSLDKGGANAFGLGTWKIRFSWNGTTEYKPGSFTVEVTVTDNRIASDIVFKEGAAITYNMDANVMKQDILDNVIDWDASTLPARDTLSVDDFTFTYYGTNILDEENNISGGIQNWAPVEGGKVNLLTYPQMGAGEQQVRITYKGNAEYRPANDVEGTVTVKKATVKVSVHSTSIYPDETVPDGFVTTDPADKFDIYTIYAGLNSNADACVYLQLPARFTNSVFLKVLDPIVAAFNDGKSFSDIMQDGTTIGELRALLNTQGLLDALDKLNIDTGTFGQILTVLNKLPGIADDVRVAFGTPDKAGLYTVFAVTDNKNYETGVGTGVLLVKMRIIGVKLEWNQSIKKLTVEEAATADFGATVTYNGEAVTDQSNVHYLYSGITSNWRVYSSTTTAPTEPGRYVVTVVTLGGNYQAAPITRSFQITK